MGRGDPGFRYSARVTARQSFPWPLREASLEHRLGDAVLEDFDRAAGDHPAAAAAHAVLDQRPPESSRARPSPAAPRWRCRSPPGCRTRLAIAVSSGGRKAAVGVGRCAIQQQLRRIELDFHVGELPLQALELAQQAPELLSLHRPLVAPPRRRSGRARASARRCRCVRR